MVWQKVVRYGLVPTLALRLLPSRVVEKRDDKFPSLYWSLLRPGVEESRETFRVVVKDDVVDQLIVGLVVRPENAQPDMPAVSWQGRSRTALPPGVARARVAL